MLLACTGLALVVALAYCTQESTTTAGLNKTDATTAENLAKRGEYLVTAGLCDDCHSPKIMTPNGPEPDPARRLSGHPSDEVLPEITNKQMAAPGQWVLFSPGFTAAVGPWGTSFSANLTPDDTGIGAWSFEQFKKAIREGKSKGMDGTRPLLPPMPWPNFKNMTDDDLRAIYTYLKTLPPVKNVVPGPLEPLANAGI